MIGGWGISSEIVLRWMSLNLADGESTLVQVRAWSCQTASQHLNQCWWSSHYAIWRLERIKSHGNQSVSNAVKKCISWSVNLSLSGFQECPNGFYANETGASECLICPAGFYCLPVQPANASLNAQPCPAGYYCPEGNSGDSFNSFAPVRFYWNFR